MHINIVFLGETTISDRPLCLCKRLTRDDIQSKQRRNSVRFKHADSGSREAGTLHRSSRLYSSESPRGTMDACKRDIREVKEDISI
jgi:hypothetical protein